MEVPREDRTNFEMMKRFECRRGFANRLHLHRSPALRLEEWVMRDNHPQSTRRGLLEHRSQPLKLRAADRSVGPVEFEPSASGCLQTGNCDTINLDERLQCFVDVLAV